MAKRKQRVVTAPEVIARALEFAQAHTNKETAAEFNVSVAAISRWKKHAKDGKGVGPTKSNTVRDAITYLRHAQRDMLARVKGGTLKEPDGSHLLAMLALRTLEGASS